MENSIVKESYFNRGFNSFAVGDTVILKSNSENIELLERILCSVGSITKILNGETHMVQFGELEVPISSFDLDPCSEQLEVM